MLTNGIWQRNFPLSMDFCCYWIFGCRWHFTHFSLDIFQQQIHLSCFTLFLKHSRKQYFTSNLRFFSLRSVAAVVNISVKNDFMHNDGQCVINTLVIYWLPLIKRHLQNWPHGWCKMNFNFDRLFVRLLKWLFEFVHLIEWILLKYQYYGQMQFARCIDCR